MANVADLKHDHVLAEKLLAAGIGDKVRFDHLRDTWLIWDGVRWRPDRQDKMLDLIRKIVVQIFPSQDADNAKALLSLLDVSKQKSVLVALGSRDGISMTGDEWDRDAHLVGFDNCVVDLRTGKPIPPDPNVLISKTVGCDFNPEARFVKGKGKTELTFEAFIESIMDGDAELVKYLWRFIGYALVGTAAEQKFWMWVGGGSNGKGVLAKVIAHCFGDYADTPADTMYMRTRMGSATSNNARPDLLRLQSCRFTYMSEPPGGQFNEELLKAHTGEDEIIARDLYAKAGQMARFAPTHKIVFLTNDPPKTDDVGNSMQRRVRVVRFEQTYPQDGGKLLDHLKSQKEAIMFYAVMMSVAWFKDRELPEPQKVLDWSDEYINENDPLADFVASKCVLGPNEKAGSSAMWVAYQEWAHANNIEIMSRTGFGLAMKKRYRTPGKPSKDSSGYIIYHGIRLKNAGDVEE